MTRWLSSGRCTIELKSFFRAQRGSNLMQAMTKLNDPAELASFVSKVEKLKSDGMTTRAIAERLGVPVATLNDRLRKFRTICANSSML